MFFVKLQKIAERFLDQNNGFKRTISGYKTKIVTAKICKKMKGITPLNISNKDIFGGATLLI